MTTNNLSIPRPPTNQKETSMPSVMQQAAVNVEPRSVRSDDLRIIAGTALVIVLAFVAMYALVLEAGPDFARQATTIVYP
jgi:hypothetical protein